MLQRQVCLRVSGEMATDGHSFAWFFGFAMACKPAILIKLFRREVLGKLQAADSAPGPIQLQRTGLWKLAIEVGRQNQTLPKHGW